LDSVVLPNLDSGRPVVVSDFDGTLTKSDLGALTLERFGTPGWERYDELFERGRITLGECIRRQSALIRARTRQEILDYLTAFSQFRTGLVRLLEECRNVRVDFVVTSAGIDFCIRHAFRVNGLPMPPLYCPSSSFTRTGLRIVMPSRLPSLGRMGGDPPGPRNFKQELVRSFQSRGRKVVYIGNGMTDVPAAAVADKVFVIAGSPLERACVQRRIAHSSIRTLLPVSKFVHENPFRR
jgi:2-hydroxy-3-keto-5-methylthiopentenyl-1-phosphate phosphatase